jgi:hypothetical protein
MIQFLLALATLGARRCSTFAVLVAAEVDGVSSKEAAPMLDVPVRFAKSALKRAEADGLLTKTNWLRDGSAVYRLTGTGAAVVKELKRRYKP